MAGRLRARLPPDAQLRRIGGKGDIPDFVVAASTRDRRKSDVYLFPDASSDEIRNVPFSVYPPYTSPGNHVASAGQSARIPSARSWIATNGATPR